MLEPTDFTVLQADAHLDLGEVLVAAGRRDEARAAYETARALAESKGGVVMIGSSADSNRSTPRSRSSSYRSHQS